MIDILLFGIPFAILAGIIIVDLIPEHIKQYINYQRTLRRDRKKGRKPRRWIWTFKAGPRFKEGE